MSLDKIEKPDVEMEVKEEKVEMVEKEPKDFKKVEKKEDEEDEDEEDSSCDEEWVTPENLHEYIQKQHEANGIFKQDDSDLISVTLITTDFAL
jgi:hypothetical protein